MFQYDRTVLAYHGCDLSTARRLLEGEPFTPSTNAYDWLGHGIYFWEHGADRAWRYAQRMTAQGKFESPAVVGALVGLGRCVDLLDTDYTHQLRDFYMDWRQAMMETGQPVPANQGRTPERKARYLDCAVLNTYLAGMRLRGKVFDTVRGVFQERVAAFEGSGIRLESHIQIAVRSPEVILGVFRPSPTTPLTGEST